MMKEFSLRTTEHACREDTKNKRRPLDTDIHTKMRGQVVITSNLQSQHRLSGVVSLKKRKTLS